MSTNKTLRKIHINGKTVDITGIEKKRKVSYMNTLSNVQIEMRNKYISFKRNEIHMDNADAEKLFKAINQGAYDMKEIINAGIDNEEDIFYPHRWLDHMATTRSHNHLCLLGPNQRPLVINRGDHEFLAEIEAFMLKMKTSDLVKFLEEKVLPSHQYVLLDACEPVDYSK